jgi:hypothetical protein
LRVEASRVRGRRQPKLSDLPAALAKVAPSAEDYRLAVERAADARARLADAFAAAHAAGAPTPFSAASEINVRQWTFRRGGFMIRGRRCGPTFRPAATFLVTDVEGSTKLRHELRRV